MSAGTGVNICNRRGPLQDDFFKLALPRAAPVPIVPTSQSWCFSKFFKCHKTKTASKTEKGNAPCVVRLLVAVINFYCALAWCRARAGTGSFTHLGAS